MAETETAGGAQRQVRGRAAPKSWKTLVAMSGSNMAALEPVSSPMPTATVIVKVEESDVVVVLEP